MSAIQDITTAHARAVDRARVVGDLDTNGFAVMPKLLAPSDCRALSGLYPDDTRFRSRIVMARHGFGRGEYKYFAYPLPERIADPEPLSIRVLRGRQPLEHGDGHRCPLPGAYAAFLTRCHDAGQSRPTPLLLEYGPGDYNCLHQDLYGEHVFPLQVAVLLSEPDAISPAANSCLPSSARACSLALR